MSEAADSATGRCSDGSRAVGEPLAGSAPFARLWVLLEQPGPWGRDALRDSHLDPEVGESLAALADAAPVRIGLIRSVGAHRDTGSGPRTLLVARTDAGSSWLTARLVEDVAALPGAFDLDALLTSPAVPHQLPGDPLAVASRALLVCTNAKRDRCCAVLGRPLAASLAAQADPMTAVWETSHTSGHRFAPTYVSLPDGYVYGGPAAEARGFDACRGRSSLEPAAQVAELAVLRALGEPTPRPLDVDSRRDGTFRVRDGATWFEVTLTDAVGPDRPESCGKSAIPTRWLEPTVRVLKP